ncbi:MAG: hypothetical protein B0A82_25495 [Alkalinema sp. CACIAM 70d]|nr:MAG: hypothetical protein B0A82_25495 [Alkalinema sp. CACIAM 70d]
MRLALDKACNSIPPFISDNEGIEWEAATWRSKVCVGVGAIRAGRASGIDYKAGIDYKDCGVLVFA